MLNLFRMPVAGLLCAVIVYLGLVVPAVTSHGMANDELIDMEIVKDYLHAGWIKDSRLDPSQSRLPMYASAMANRVLGTESLIVSRLVSILCGALTLVGVYLFCARNLSAVKGLVAATLLAISPYFLAFTKVAMTEGEAFGALFGTGFALATAELLRRQTVGTACLAAGAGALAVSAKVPCAVWFFAAFFILRLRQPGSRTPPSVYLLLLPLLCGLGAVAAGWSVIDAAYDDRAAPYLVQVAVVVLAWAVFVAGAVYWRNRAIGTVAAVWLTGMGALLTFFVVPPVHTASPAVVQEAVRLLAGGGYGLPEGLVWSTLVLHILVLLLKSGPAMGVLLIASLLLAPWFVPRRRVLIIPILFIVSYVLLFVMTGRGQTFYMIGVMPFFCILAGDVLGELVKRARPVFAAVLALVSLNAAADLLRVYPDMHLNGYQWLGERYIAHRSTLGYKSVAQTPSDGTMQVIHWAKHHINPGERVLTYLRDRMVVRYLGPASGVYFHVRNGFDPNRTLDEANYVLVHINATLRQYEADPRPLVVQATEDVESMSTIKSRTPGTIYTYPFDRRKLESEFRKVYSVRRAFGIEVATVWYRKDPYEFDLRGNAME